MTEANTKTHHDENIPGHGRVKLCLRLKVRRADRSIEVSRAHLWPAHGDSLHLQDV